MTADVSTPGIRQTLSAAEQRLSRAGVASARHDAEALAAHVLGVPRCRLALVDAAQLGEVKGQLDAALARRAAREPLQHVVGTTGFRRLELAVGPGVLVPRPETELLVDAVLNWLRSAGVARPRVVDLGTGTGALALALADECPSATMWAVERDPSAVAWAARNIAASGLAVDLVEGDMRTALPQLNGTVDVVVANPPYLPLELRPALEPEVRDYDPPQALFAGADPLSAIRAVESAGRRLLRPAGIAVVEHGEDQGTAAPACFATGWEAVTDFPDLSGRPRYLTAVRA
jgi:release factor glutamine methyltransferase